MLSVLGTETMCRLPLPFLTCPYIAYPADFLGDLFLLPTCPTHTLPPHPPSPHLQLAFGCLAYPCLVLTYLGQGAYLLQHPQVRSQGEQEGIMPRKQGV